MRRRVVPVFREPPPAPPAARPAGHALSELLATTKKVGYNLAVIDAIQRAEKVREASITGPEKEAVTRVITEVKRLLEEQ